MLDDAHATLDTVAIGFSETESEAEYFASTKVNSAEKKQLLSLFRARHIAHRSQDPNDKSILSLLVPTAIAPQLDILSALLTFDRGVYPFLVFVAEPGQTFTHEHSELMRTLIEPFSVAVKNDSQLR